MIYYERLQRLDRQARIELAAMVLEGSGISQSWPDWSLDAREFISGHSRRRQIAWNRVIRYSVTYFCVMGIIGRFGVLPTAKSGVLVRLLPRGTDVCGNQTNFGDRFGQQPTILMNRVLCVSDRWAHTL